MTGTISPCRIIEDRAPGPDTAAGATIRRSIHAAAFDCRILSTG